MGEALSRRYLQQTLDKFAVPQAEQAEVKAIVASTRGGYRHLRARGRRDFRVTAGDVADYRLFRHMPMTTGPSPGKPARTTNRKPI